MAAMVNGNGNPQFKSLASLARCEEPTWDRLLTGFPRRAFPARQKILRQGAPATRVFTLSAGAVKLVRSSPDGRSTIAGVRFAGSILGVGAALLDAPEPLSVVTLAPSQFVEVPASDFALLVKGGGELSWSVHLEHCRELQRELEQAAGLALLSARERLESFLTLLCTEIDPTRLNGCGAVGLPLRDCELAQLLGITPQWMCRLMRELADCKRLLKVGNRWHFLPTSAAIPAVTRVG